MIRRPSNDPSTLLVVLQIVAVLWALAIVPLALLLILVADTWVGRGAAGWAVAAGLLPWCAVRVQTAEAWRKIAVGLGVLLAMLTAVLLTRLPDGNPSAEQRATNKYSGPDAHFVRLAPANLMPEVDQLRLGFTLVPLLDSLFTTSQAARLKASTAEVYREMAADPEFRGLGSSLTGTYAELLGWSLRRDHSYVYVPRGLNREKPAPLFVFFHGSGGNFKGYLWVLSKMADRAGFVLVAPSNGMGNWRADESASSLDRAIEAAAGTAAIDRHRIIIGGLSNGGLAVTQLANQRGSELAALVLISPVFDESATRSLALTGQQGRNLPVFAITGGRDDRVPASYVESHLAMLKNAGVRLHYEPVADADHFLIFTHRHRLEDALVSWLQEADFKP